MDKEKQYYVLIFLCCVPLFFMHLNVMPVTIMEARNFISAREMLTDSNWILTTMNDVARYQKPPLPTWLSAICAAIFGIKNEFAYRLPVSLMALFTVFSFFRLIKHITTNQRLAFISALILATSMYIIAIQREAPWDIYTHGFIVAAVLYLYKLFTEDVKKIRNGFIAGIFLGLSILGKGPIGLYALLLPFLIAFGTAFKYRNIKSAIVPLLVFVCVGLLLGGWWYAYVRWLDPEAFLKIAERETNNWSNYNVKPFYYYWSFFTQSGIWTVFAIIGLVYPYLKDKTSHKKAYLFSLVWALSVLILLSIIPEKKSRYLVPVLIPLALSTAFYIDYLILNFKGVKHKGEKILAYFSFGLIGVIGLVAGGLGYFFLKDELLPQSMAYFIVLAVFLFALGVVLFINLKRKNIQNAFLCVVFFMLGVAGLGLPISKSFRTNKAYKNIAEWNSKLNDKPLYHFGAISPEMLWHSGKIVPAMENNNKTDCYVLVGKNEEKNFLKQYKQASKPIITFDLNETASPNEKGHKNRLTAVLYLIKN